MPGVIVDIGTGDGEFVYKLAKDNPDRFVIGIEPNHQGLEKVSAKINKKPAKGGLKNALFVLGSIEGLPEELNGLVNQVFINFPWSGLLKGLLLADDAAWNPLKRIGNKGTLIDILFSYEPAAEETEFKKLGLPAINLEYLQNVIAPRLEAKGFRVVRVKAVGQEDLKNYPSTWAKKLVFGRERKYYYIRAEIL